MIKHVIEELAPIRERRAELENHPQRVEEILESGTQAAQQQAAATMAEARETIGL
jgi:tryptophanyl-tRNA synthetase